MRLIDLLTLGDIATSLLSNTLRKFEMNRTEFQVCWVLAECAEGPARPRLPQTLGQVARQLCVPDSRIANQLPKLIKSGFIARATPAPERIDVDRRLRFYRLTQKGCLLVDRLLLEIASIDEVLNFATSQKTDMVITHYVEHLRCGLEANAFDSLHLLAAAMVGGALPVKRKLSVPPWSRLASLMEPPKRDRSSKDQ